MRTSAYFQNVQLELLISMIRYMKEKIFNEDIEDLFLEQIGTGRLLVVVLVLPTEVISDASGEHCNAGKEIVLRCMLVVVCCWWWWWSRRRN